MATRVSHDLVCPTCIFSRLCPTATVRRMCISDYEHSAESLDTDTSHRAGKQNQWINIQACVWQTWHFWTAHANVLHLWRDQVNQFCSLTVFFLYKSLPNVVINCHHLNHLNYNHQNHYHFTQTSSTHRNVKSKLLIPTLTSSVPFNQNQKKPISHHLIS